MHDHDQSAAAQPTVLAELTDGVLLVTLNRPERLNATTPDMIRLYTQTLLNAAEDSAVRAIVVTGAGRGFCAGADTSVLGALSDGGPRAVKLRRHWFTTTIPKPVIAAINGPCIGLGFAMALMCDMRIAAKSARMGATFARLGLPAENGIDWMLVRMLGYARAFEILATGELFSGDDLKQLGLVNRLVEDGAVVDAAMQLARSMASHCSPRSLAMIKTQLQRDAQVDLRDADALADQLIGMSLESADFREALSSRKEKRPPCFEPLGSVKPWWPSDSGAA